MTTCILFAVCQVVGWRARKLLKFINNCEGLVVCLQYPVQPFLAWSVVANLPNNGVSLHLQKSTDKNLFLFDLSS